MVVLVELELLLCTSSTAMAGFQGPHCSHVIGPSNSFKARQARCV